jgi:nucleoside-diphosphate-sugar epimerase
MVFEPLPQDDPKVRRPNIARAQDLLGWKPEVTLEVGLRRTIEYFRELLA